MKLFIWSLQKLTFLQSMHLNQTTNNMFINPNANILYRLVGVHFD